MERLRWKTGLGSVGHGCSGNPDQGTGNPKSGEDYGPAPNIDHSNESIRNDIKEWLNWLRDEIGFRGWRFDFVKGYNGVYSGEYVEATSGRF